MTAPRSPSTAFRRIAIFGKEALGPASGRLRDEGPGPAVARACRSVAKVAAEFGATVTVEPSLAPIVGRGAGVEAAADVASADLLISLGGDGTLLRAARSVLEDIVPGPEAVPGSEPPPSPEAAPSQAAPSPETIASLEAAPSPGTVSSPGTVPRQAAPGPETAPSPETVPGSEPNSPGPERNVPLSDDRAPVPERVPILGINLGNLGFLASVAAAEVESGLRRVLRGEYEIEKRRTLEAEVRPARPAPAAQHQPAGRVADRFPTVQRFTALNDVVVHKAGAARVTRLDLWVGEGEGRQEIGSFSGDGVILATPTGSTAYSLSAGGPIVVPELNCFLVTPILPHTLAVRPLVMPGDEEITVTILDRGEPLHLTVDGREGTELRPTDRVVVRMGRSQLRLVRLPNHSFFATLRRKLNWAVNPPEGH